MPLEASIPSPTAIKKRFLEVNSGALRSLEEAKLGNMTEYHNAARDLKYLKTLLAKTETQSEIHSALKLKHDYLEKQLLKFGKVEAEFDNRKVKTKPNFLDNFKSFFQPRITIDRPKQFGEKTFTHKQTQYAYHPPNNNVEEHFVNTHSKSKIFASRTPGTFSNLWLALRESYPDIIRIKKNQIIKEPRFSFRRKYA